MQEIFLPPNTPNSKVVGRFVPWTKTWTDQNGEKKSRPVVSLQTMVPGIAEPTSCIVPPGPAGDKIKKEWAQAWALFEKQQQRTEPEIPTATEHGIRGTPIESADFIGKDHLHYLKLQGFLTLEQLADMSDTQCNNVGFGARDWRRKAKEHLVVVRDHAAVQAPIGGPSVADLAQKLDEATAIMAKQAELIELLKAQTKEHNARLAASGGLGGVDTYSASVEEAAIEAPKPRRGRPRKPEAAETQAEA